MDSSHIDSRGSEKHDPADASLEKSGIPLTSPTLQSAAGRVPIFSSHTARNTWMTCQRLYKYSYVDKLELDGPKPAPLRMGAAFAECLEYADSEHAGPIYEAYHGAPITSDLHDELREEEIVVRVMADAYLERYPVEADLEREVGFESVHLGVGRLDGIYESGLVSVEDKFMTKRWWMASSERSLAYCPQVSAYFAARREAGMPLKKCDYRVTFKPACKRASKRGPKGGNGQPESLDAFEVRLRNSVASDHDVFRRYDLYRTDRQLDEYLADVAALNRQLAVNHDTGSWPQNRQSCSAFSGCPMLALCADGDRALPKYRTKIRT